MTHERLLRALLILYGLALLVGLSSLIHPNEWRWSRGAKRGSGTLAVVHVYGAIRTSLAASAWGNPDADEIARRLHRISENDQIKAIVLRINSPGGTVGAVQEIYAELLRCKAKGKKVVASLGALAASGGYY